MIKIPFKTDQSNPTIRAYNEAMEKGKDDQHVFVSGPGWIVKNLWTGTSNIFIRKSEAVEYAESIAKGNGATVFIHGADGRINERRDF